MRALAGVRGATALELELDLGACVRHHGGRCVTTIAECEECKVPAARREPTNLLRDLSRRCQVRMQRAFHCAQTVRDPGRGSDFGSVRHVFAREASASRRRSGQDPGRCRTGDAFRLRARRRGATRPTGSYVRCGPRPRDLRARRRHLSCEVRSPFRRPRSAAMSRQSCGKAR